MNFIISKYNPNNGKTLDKRISFDTYRDAEEYVSKKNTTNKTSENWFVRVINC